MSGSLLSICNAYGMRIISWSRLDGRMSLLGNVYLKSSLDQLRSVTCDTAKWMPQNAEARLRGFGKQQLMLVQIYLVMSSIVPIQVHMGKPK